jgi:hypothetical protein
MVKLTINRYTKFGASAMFDGCENLSQEIKLEVDGENVEIPAKMQGLIIVNLPSYAAGLNMWRGEIPKGNFCFYYLPRFFSFLAFLSRLFLGFLDFFIFIYTKGTKASDRIMDQVIYLT